MALRLKANSASSHKICGNFAVRLGITSMPMAALPLKLTEVLALEHDDIFCLVDGS